MSDRAYLISRLQAYKQIVENEIKDPVATQLLAETIQELSFEPKEEDSLDSAEDTNGESGEE